MNNRWQFLHMNQCKPSDIHYLMRTFVRDGTNLCRPTLLIRKLKKIDVQIPADYDICWTTYWCINCTSVAEHWRSHQTESQQEDWSSTAGSCFYWSCLLSLLHPCPSFPPRSPETALQRKLKLFPALTDWLQPAQLHHLTSFLYPCRVFFKKLKAWT